MKEGGIFKTDAEYNERKNKNGVYRDKMKVLLFLSEMIIPLILFYVVGFGVLMKCDIYEEFVKGAKEGLETVIQILPTLIGLMVAVGVLRASGFLTMLPISPPIYLDGFCTSSKYFSIFSLSISNLRNYF